MSFSWVCLLFLSPVSERQNYFLSVEWLPSVLVQLKRHSAPHILCFPPSGSLLFLLIANKSVCLTLELFLPLK